MAKRSSGVSFITRAGGLPPRRPSLRLTRRTRRRRLRLLGVLGAFCLWVAASGCTVVSSTARRSAVVGLGAGGTAGTAYALSDRKPEAAVAGAVVGGTLTHLALGQDPEVLQEGFDRGYVQGQSDAIKRQYFLRQALEITPLPQNHDQGETVYYVVPGPEVTTDGRKLAPHQVAVRVVE